MRKILIKLSALGIVLVSLSSQAQIKYNTWTFGVQTGNIADLPKAIIGKEGDQDPVSFGSPHAQFNWTYGAYVEKQMSPIIGLHLSYDRSENSGSTSIDYYVSDFHRFNFSMTLSLTNLTSKKGDPYLNLYGIAGIGYNKYKAQRYFNSGVRNTLASRNKSASQINIGFGVRKHLSERLRIEFESTYNLVFDNGFDGDSFNFDKGQDQYLRTVFGLAYTIGGEDRAMHKTPLFASDYLWGDDKIKKRIKPDEDYLAEQIEENIADEKAQIAQNTQRIDNLEGDVQNLGDKLNTFINSFDGEIVQTRNVYYATDKHKITPEYQKMIQEIVTILRSNPDYLVDVTGVTDIYASETYNAKLRVRRAEEVKAFMIKKFNIDPNRITTNTQKEKVSGIPYQHLNRKTQIVVYRNLKK